MSTYQHDDDGYDLNDPPGVPDGDHAIARLLRDAMIDSSPSPQQLEAAVSHAHQRAARRRHWRVAGTSVVAFCSLAILAPVMMNLEQLHPRGFDGVVSAASQEPALHTGGPSRLLSPIEVEKLLDTPGLAGPDDLPLNGPDIRLDACGRSPLPGLVAPVKSQAERWSSRDAPSFEPGADSKILATVMVDEYATAEQAQAFVRSLKQSITVCSPVDGEAAPTNPIISEVFLADVVYVRGRDGDRVDMTTIIVDGRKVAMVQAWVLASESQQSLEGAAVEVSGAAMAAMRRSAES